MKYAISPGLIFLLLCTFSCGNQGTGQTSGEEEIITEAHRPAFHFTPDSMWMNDPNGLVFYKGEYHLFYQHYPFDVVWGPMHWGHAISTDLVHWQNLPIALYPDSLGYIFSGSAVVDLHNTSGLGSLDNPPLVAVFTQHNEKLARSGSDRFEYQSIAYSLGNGRDWEKFAGNPVLENPGIRDFRDPKVTWFEKGNKWIMVLAAHNRVRFYSSPDLINWTFESEFGELTGAHGGVWECPDLFQLESNGSIKWILLVSINPGGPNGGAATQYFTGAFDGNQYINENPSAEPLWIDWGTDNYAGVTWSNISAVDGRRIFIGWMSNPLYAQKVPTEKWRSAMTIPRELNLARIDDHWIVASTPVSEISLLRNDSVVIDNKQITGELPIEGISNFSPSQYEIVLEIAPEKDQDPNLTTNFGLILSNDLDQNITAGIDMAERQVYINRRAAGKNDFSEHFAGLHTAPYSPPENGMIKIHAVIDRASIELFIDDGRVVMTDIFFPDRDFDRVSLFCSEGIVTLKEGKIYELSNSDF